MIEAPTVRIVALGPGGVDEVPSGALRVLVAARRADLRCSPALRDVLAELGVEHVEGAPLVAAPDGAALALVTPDTELVPERLLVEARIAADALARLWSITVRLRRDCPWDREQTAASIVPHTIEEAYEVADKALAGPPGVGLVDELGDLLFQVYFLALLASEAGAGDLSAVAEAITAKLVRRHPHVFGDATAATADDVRGRWDAIKRDQEGREGIFHDVPGALPALLLARKVQRRAAAVGFDWQRYEDAWPAISEELAELAEALELHGTDGVEPATAVVHEAGDLLFAAVNVLRLAGVDPELALRASSSRFRGRVEGAERLAATAGLDFRLLSSDEQEGYYRAAKRQGETGEDVT